MCINSSHCTHKSSDDSNTQVQCLGGGIPTHQVILKQLGVLQFNEIQTLYSIRFYRLRAQSFNLSHPLFKNQLQVQVVTCASD